MPLQQESDHRVTAKGEMERGENSEWQKKQIRKRRERRACCESAAQSNGELSFGTQWMTARNEDAGSCALAGVKIQNIIEVNRAGGNLLSGLW